MNTDIVLGSAHAFLETINRISAEEDAAARNVNGAESLKRSANQAASANGKDHASAPAAARSAEPALRSTPK